MTEIKEQKDLIISSLKEKFSPTLIENSLKDGTCAICGVYEKYTQYFKAIGISVCPLDHYILDINNPKSENFQHRDEYYEPEDIEYQENPEYCKDYNLTMADNHNRDYLSLLQRECLTQMNEFLKSTFDGNIVCQYGENWTRDDVSWRQY